jgi:hypothetical protein
VIGESARECECDGVCVRALRGYFRDSCYSQAALQQLWTAGAGLGILVNGGGQGPHACGGGDGDCGNDDYDDDDDDDDDGEGDDGGGEVIAVAPPAAAQSPSQPLPASAKPSAASATQQASLVSNTRPPHRRAPFFAKVPHLRRPPPGRPNAAAFPPPSPRDVFVRVVTHAMGSFVGHNEPGEFAFGMATGLCRFLRAIGAVEAALEIETGGDGSSSSSSCSSSSSSSSGFCR